MKTYFKNFFNFRYECSVSNPLDTIRQSSTLKVKVKNNNLDTSSNSNSNNNIILVVVVCVLMLIILMVLICVIFCTRSRNSLNGQTMSNRQNLPGKDEDWNFRNLPKSNIPTDPNEYIDNQQYHQRRSSHVGRYVALKKK